MDSPDDLATIFVDATGLCIVEILIVDPDDGALLWTYRFFHSGPPKCIN
jgi:hypothetical protein